MRNIDKAGFKKLTFSAGPEESTAATAVLTEVSVSQLPPPPVAVAVVVEIILGLSKFCGDEDHNDTSWVRGRRIRLVFVGEITPKAANEVEFRVAAEVNIATSSREKQVKFSSPDTALFNGRASSGGEDDEKRIG